MVRLFKDNSYKGSMMEDVEIEVKNKGVLEVPEGKTVDQLPMSHFEKLAKEKGLSKITKALNNLQVWNKNDDPKLSKWAGNMIDKLNKKLKKDENLSIRDAKRIAADDESMGMLDDIAKMQKNRASRTEYEQKDDDKKIKDYVKRINDKLNTKESLVKESILQEEDDYWWAQIPSDLVDVVKEMERLGWEGVGYTTTGVDYCISATDSNRPELDYEMCVSIQEYDDAVSLSKYVDIYDWDKEKEVSRVPNSSGVSEMYTVDDVRKFTNWFNALANGGNRGSNVRLNRESLGYDRYDPNVEAQFMELNNLYDDIPDEDPTQDDVFEFYVSYCMNNCRNEEEARKYLEYENLPESFIDSIIEEVYNRFDEQL